MLRQYGAPTAPETWGQEITRIIRFYVTDLGAVLSEAISESGELKASLKRKFISGKKVS